nr:penicillin acylase family protein [Pseudoroseomonas vastitatis]
MSSCAADSYLGRRTVAGNANRHDDPRPWAFGGHRVSETTHLAGVSGKVEIVRDDVGIPHIFASSSADLQFGLGFAMAEDRLWQIDRLRRRALGRQAEVMGQAYLATDIAHRTVGLPEIAGREAEAMDPITAPLVDAFVAGINRGIAVLELPPEFGILGYKPEPFTRVCVVAIARGLWWSLNGRIDRLAAAEAARFLPERLREDYLTPEGSDNLILPSPAFSPPHAAGTDDATGSNNWALNPALTGGSAILAGDPHQPFWVPSSWYEFALHGPEDNAAGCGHPGVPGLLWGSNGTIAFCLTNNMASTRDLYAETVNPDDAAQYWDGEGWRAFEETTEVIYVKDAPDHSLTIRRTVRGPIVNALVPPLTEGGDPPLSLRWVGMEHIDDMRALVNLSRAKDWDAFRNTLRDWSVAVFNWIYADIHGNVGYQMAGRLPLRPRFAYGYRDATNPDDRWSGYIPFEQLPHSYNPPRGYVASANQRVIPPEQEPMIYGAYSQGHRGIRLDQIFTAPSTHNRAATIAVQNDVVNTRAQRLVPAILRLLPAEDPVARILGSWDFAYTLESAAPTVFETFMFLWQRAIVAAHMPARLRDLVVQQTGLGCAMLLEPERPFFPEGTGAVARDVAAKVLDTLCDRLGVDGAAWVWGKVHLAHWKHPLSNAERSATFDIGPAAVDGGSHTLRNTGGELPPHNAASGAEYRIVVDFAEPDRFLAVQNIGNSGIPGHKHYSDQFVPWLRGDYHTMHLNREHISVQSVTVLVPT